MTMFKRKFEEVLLLYLLAEHVIVLSGLRH